MTQPIYSLLLPVLNEAEALPSLHAALVSAMADIRVDSFEIIFVDDGSTDDSWSLLCDLASKDRRVYGIRLGRNFGKATALAAGIAHAHGEFIFMLDADLQNDPHDIPLLMTKMNEGYDMVVGWRKYRQDARHKVVLSKIFNLIVGLISGLRLHDANCGLKGGRAGAFKSIKLYGQLHRFIPLLAWSKGARVSEVAIGHIPRPFGESRYGLSRYWHAARDFPVALVISKWKRLPWRVGFIAFVIALLASLDLLAPWLAGIAAVLITATIVRAYQERRRFVVNGDCCIRHIAEVTPPLSKVAAA